MPSGSSIGIIASPLAVDAVQAEPSSAGIPCDQEKKGILAFLDLQRIFDDEVQRRLKGLRGNSLFRVTGK
jgi:hypothetical protein